VKGDLLLQFKFQDQIKQELQSACFANQTFCVLLTNAGDKTEIENMVRMLGGNVIANPVKDKMD